MQITKLESENGECLTLALPSQKQHPTTARGSHHLPPAPAFMLLPGTLSSCYLENQCHPLKYQQTFKQSNENKYARLVRKSWLDKCQSRGLVAEELAFISEERLEKGQEDTERTGGRAELRQGWLRAPWYTTIARVVSCSTKANTDLCSWKSFPTTALAPSPTAALLHSQQDQQPLESQTLT